MTVPAAASYQADTVMDPTSTLVRFPATAFRSQAEFLAFRRDAQDRLDARYLYETTLIGPDAVLVQPGTCAPCLRRTRFTSDTRGWARRADGQAVPDWDAALHCDCPERLSKRARAVVHCAQDRGALRPWTRLLLFGPPDPSHQRLSALAGTTLTCPAPLPAAGGLHLGVPDEACHLAVAVDCLHRVPALDAALAAFRRALVPGGALLFTVPFRHDAAASTTRADLRRPDGRLPPLLREAAHELGWDILPRLLAAGFTHAAAHGYWSAELGYLGPFGMIFLAER